MALDHRYSDWFTGSPAGELARHVEAVQEAAVGIALGELARRSRSRTGRAAGTPSWRRPPATRARTPATRRTLASGSASPVGQQQAARDRVARRPARSRSCCDRRRVLALRVVQQHVAAEVRVAGQDLVGAFAGQDDLVAGVAHGPAQQVLRDAVRVEAERLGLPDRVGEVVGEVGLPDRDRVELGPDVLPPSRGRWPPRRSRPGRR